MTSAIQSGRGPSLRDTYRVPVVNGASESAPAYGVLQISAATPVGSTTLYTVTKPTGAANAKYLLNPPQALGVGQAGAAGDVYPAPALIIGTPAINQELGPVAGSWGLSTRGKGFLYVGGLSGSVGYVASKGGTMAGDDFPLVRIINASGLPKPAGSIVGYGTPYNFPPQTIERIPVWYYTAPTANQAYVVTLAPATADEIVDAAPVGVVNVQVYQNKATDEYAKVVSGTDTNLTSAATGSARILWRERGLVAGEGTLGLQWAIVELGAGQSSDDIRGVSYSTIPAATGPRDGATTPGVGLAKIYTMPTGPAGTAWAIDSSPVTVENWMRGSIASYKPILLRPSRSDNSGQTIYTVISEGCVAIPSG